MGRNTFWEKLGNWELWPFPLRYAALMPFWVGYCMRAGSPWFFTASNPTITFGGFDGEGKKEMYALLPEGSYPKTLFVTPGMAADQLLQQVQAAGFQYPFCVKPDVGLKGLLFRKIDNEAELLRYHSAMPLEYMVQDLVLLPLEVSIFYYRHPTHQKGTISGFIQKDLMEVVGNGRDTLHQLILAHPIARHRMAEMQTKHADNFDTILPQGQQYLLAYAANLNRGARFSQLTQHIDERLQQLFDDLSHRTEFYYGRYDIKCQSVELLQQGKAFQILEFNGAGAEPNHVYHAGLSLTQAHTEIKKHWKALYEISKYNHEHGHPYWPFWKGYHFLKKAGRHGKHLEALDKEILV
ncbi:ATP-grasp domain-containing protein [Pseudocnuella soli]|uniref:hypothetical protein n=1 Tax=Pseudocnuella soli TaxID=2502779 RepID=UPI00104963E9|nr:hypothetical protein [Pseudocnuella soli]